MHHVISGSMELGLGRYPAGHPSAWQLQILPCALAEHPGLLVFEGHLHGPLCAMLVRVSLISGLVPCGCLAFCAFFTAVIVVFGSLFSFVLLVSGLVALVMLLLFAFMFAFSDILLLVLCYLRSFHLLNHCLCVVFGSSFSGLFNGVTCVLGLWLPMPFVVTLISSIMSYILRVQLSCQWLLFLCEMLGVLEILSKTRK